MKNLCKASLAVAIAAAAFSSHAQAQTVVLNGLGSSAMFLQLGLAASTSSTASGAINATCIWSENTNAAWASDTAAANTDAGNAWVAWTPGTNGSCTSPASDSKVYAYLQTDSVVGNRCLFDGSCTMHYPTSSIPASAGLIQGTSEVALPSSVAGLLNTAPNFAGTDIRPEDAAFATIRAINPTGNTLPCGTAIKNASGNATQYLGLGYSSGGVISGSALPTGTTGQGFGSSFNVVSFSLPSSFTVTPLGAVPVLVVVNSNDTAANGALTQFSNITSANLAKFLDGSYSAANAITGGTGTDPIYVFEREPLSGTYNTMEYNVPNTTGNQTSQDVGYNQPAAQRACNADGTPINPLTISTSSTGSSRFRAIGTGNALKATRTFTDSHSVINNLGYGFWSVANYAGFAGVSTAKYLTVDSVDPLGASGVIPTTTAQINAVDFSTVANGTYPIYSLLRLVTTTSSATSAATTLQSAVQNFVGKNYPTTRPDFVQLADITTVRSHFAPPSVTVGSGNAIIPANGDTQFAQGSSSHCTAMPEAGGDVGGVVIALSTDSTYCTQHHVTTGQTGLRR